MVELESSGMPCTGRSAAKWYIDRSSKRHSKREGYRKGYEKDI